LNRVYPRVSSSLARRIDRLARGAHALHRWAHHPLCGRYESEVFRFGRRARVCRGCSLALLGSVLGGLGGALFGIPWAALVSVSCSLGLVGWSMRRARKDRASKIAARFLPACGLTFALFSFVHARSPASVGIAAAACAVALAFIGVYKQRGPNRAPCASCPERSDARTCSGFQPIVRREKALMRKTAAMIRTEDVASQFDIPFHLIPLHRKTRRARRRSTEASP